MTYSDVPNDIKCIELHPFWNTDSGPVLGSCQKLIAKFFIDLVHESLVREQIGHRI